MRVELALIVGILFFCCWCAYIIVKMNSSVSSTSQPNNLQPLASDATFTRLNNGSDISSYLYNHQAITSNQAPMNTMMIGRNQLRQQPQASYVRQESIHQQPTTTVEGRYFAQPSMTNIHHQMPPLQQSKPPYSALTNAWASTATSTSQPTNRYNNHHQSSTPISSANNAWRSQYYQNNAAQNTWRPQIAAQSYFGRPSANNYTPPQYMTTNNRMPTNVRQYQHHANSWHPAAMNHHYQRSPPQFSRNLYSKQSQRSSMDNPESENDSDLDPDPDTDTIKQSQQGEDGQGEEEQPAPSNEQEASVEDEQQQQQPPDLNKEIEEQNGQRSYSEDESDANERDKDGNLIITHHKHLINGKPVNKAGNSKKRASPHKGNPAGGDFEKIANEIEDEENQDRPDYDDVANGQQQTDESRRRQKLIEPSSSGLVNLDRPILGQNKTMNQATFESRLNPVQRPSPARNKTGGLKHVIKHGKRRVKNNEKKAKQTVEDEIDEADPLPKRGKELHDHQLRESLTAQQWDDDSSSPNINDNNNKTTKIDNKANDGEQLESLSSSDGSDNDNNNADKQAKDPSDGNKNEDINTKEEMEAEGETGPQQVEADFKDLDLISDPEKFMHSDKRRKRQADIDEPYLAISKTNTTHLNNTIENLKQLGDNVSKLHTNQSVIEISPNGVDFDDVTNISNVKDVSQLHIGNNTKLDGVEEDGVSSQEDINHEMAANPPLPDDENNAPGEQQTNQAVAINVLPPLIHQNDPQATNEADAYSKFYDNQPPDQPGFVSYPTQTEEVPPSPNSFYQNGHSSGPYDVPPPQFYPDNQPNQEQQQHYHHDNQNNPPRPTSLLAPPQEAVEYNTNQPVDHVIDQMIDTNSQPDQDKPSNEVDYNPLASGSKSKSKKVKKKKKFKKSKLTESKRKAAHAESLKKKSKSKKGGRHSKKKKAEKKFAASSKEFKGSKKGNKKAKGGAQQGGNKGNLYYKDKGYKKRGFKKAYQKLETGDHKTYFDEFRDKDHNKKWKNFKDKHHYSQSKHWKGKDHKKYDNYDLKEMKDKKHGVSKHKSATKYKKKSKHSSDKAYEKKKKLKKKMKKKEKKYKKDDR